MKVVLKKRPLSTPPPAPGQRKPPRAAPQSAAPANGGGTGWIKWVFVALLGCAAIGAVLAYRAAEQRREAAIRRAQVRRTSAANRPGQVPGGILGNFDMQAWCKEHDKDNAELQARRARMRGGQPQPAAAAATP